MTAPSSPRPAQPLALALPRSARLSYAPLALEDADFLVELLTDPDFLRYIGERGVRTAADVEGYLRAGPWQSYLDHGFGLLKLSELATGRPVGIAGLLRRPTLDDVDLGYALLPPFRGCGYVTEACQALLQLASNTLGLRRVVAIVSPDNERSIATLLRLGFAFECTLQVGGDAPDVRLYGCPLAPAVGEPRSTGA